MLPVRVKRHTQNGEVISETTINIPAIWDELTLGQFMAILTTPKIDAAELLSILTGWTREFCLNIPSDSLTVVGNNLFFLTEDAPDFSQWKMPKQFQIGDGMYDIPKDLKKESWGQKVMAQQEINDMIQGKAHTYEPLPYVLAVYFYTKVTGDREYTDEKIRGFVPTIMTTSVKEALPIGTFFLTSLLPSSTPKQKRFLLTQLRNRQLLELKDLTSLA